MKTFTRFLIEQTEETGKPLKHLTHVEDHVIHGGNDGVKHAAQVLDDTHNSLLGKSTHTKLSTKYDGAPSIVFGYHPKNGRFFVASKSAFNKNPKINHTEHDIEQNHGHAPGLVDKLKVALKELPKITPKAGVYQGDVMHTKKDIQKHGKKLKFTPNTITYGVDENTAHGKAIKASKFGIVVHTKYKGSGDLHNMHATPDVDHENFTHHPDVHNINPKLNHNIAHYTPKEQQKYLDAMAKAKQVYAKMKPEALDAVKKHSVDLEAHVNDMVRKDDTPSVEGYLKHVTNKYNKHIEALKSDKAKDAKRQQLSAALKHVSDNQHHFRSALELHSHLQTAKDVLTNVMSKNHDFEHHIGGMKTGPEGIVAVTKDGNMSKFVNRKQFSRQNFLLGKMQQAKNNKNEKV